MVTFWLSALKLGFYSYICVLDFHHLISRFIAYVVFFYLMQCRRKLPIIMKDFDKLKLLLLFLSAFL